MNNEPIFSVLTGKNEGGCSTNCPSCPEGLSSNQATGSTAAMIAYQTVEANIEFCGNQGQSVIYNCVSEVSDEYNVFCYCLASC